MLARAPKLPFSEYLSGMSAAKTTRDLEKAIQADRNHPFLGPKWTRTCNVRKAAGLAICDQSRLGHYIPQFGPGRRLTVCGESYRVARGGNGAGIRYAWYYADEWTSEVLRRNGVPPAVLKTILSWWASYPHRALRAVEIHQKRTARKLKLRPTSRARAASQMKG